MLQIYHVTSVTLSKILANVTCSKIALNVIGKNKLIKFNAFVQC